MSNIIPSLFGRDDDGRDVMQTMRRDVDRMFEDFARRLPGGWFGAEGATPRIDVAETDTAIEVTAEIPGVEEKDLDVNVTGNILTIGGEKRQEQEEKKKNFHRVERSYGSFRRSLSLPFDVDPDKVSARFDKGVLHVQLPKPPEVQQKSRKIEVASGT